MNKTPQFMTGADVERMFGFSKGAVSHALRRGKIRAVAYGGNAPLFDQQAVDDWRASVNKRNTVDNQAANRVS